MSHSHINYFPDFRCKCNGHANSCELVPRNETVIITAEDGSQQTQTANIEIMECKCEHGTDGPNCEMCLPDHNSRPWKRAEQDNAHECRRKYQNLDKKLVHNINYSCIPEVEGTS